jgi:hypothetical protein
VCSEVNAAAGWARKRGLVAVNAIRSRKIDMAGSDSSVSVSVLEDIFENVQIGPRASAVALVRTVQQKERGILAINDQGL